MQIPFDDDYSRVLQLREVELRVSVLRRLGNFSPRLVFLKESLDELRRKPKNDSTSATYIPGYGVQSEDDSSIFRQVSPGLAPEGSVLGSHCTKFSALMTQGLHHTSGGHYAMFKALEEISRYASSARGISRAKTSSKGKLKILFGPELGWDPQ